MIIDSFRGQYAFLSNYYPVNLTSDGITYPTVEHAFQANKSTDYFVRKRIAACRTPGEAKALGRKVVLRDNWENIKDACMYFFVYKKFKENPNLQRLLLNTGNEILVEGNDWSDFYWGVCNGVGQNKLGNILMEVRDKLRGKANNS